MQRCLIIWSGKNKAVYLQLLMCQQQGMELIISKHAREQMLRRGIDYESVLMVVYKHQTSKISKYYESKI
jgi:hypothetical protein